MKRLALGVLALALPLHVNAQVAVSDPGAAATQQAAALAAGDSTGPSLQTLNLPFQVTAYSDQQLIKFSDKIDLNGLFGAGQHHDYLFVTAQTPLAQGSDFTDTTSLDGLTKSSSLELRLSMLRGGAPYFSKPIPPGPVKPMATWIFTLDGKVGTQDHDYFDPVTLLKHTTQTTSWQAGGSVGGIFDEGHASANLTFDYQEFFQDGGTGQTSTQCLTVDNCVTGFIGAPVLTHQGLISGDLRWIGKLNDTYPLGIEVKLTYDPIQDAEAVQVPIYFATNDDGALSSGIRYNWNSTDHVSTVGVFVSSAFSVGF